MNDRGKRLHQVCARVDETTLAEIDRYQRDREREARLAMSRSLVLLEVLEDWARARVRARVDRGEPSRHG